MTAHRFCLTVLLTAGSCVAAYPADGISETFEALRKAKTKEDRLAVLKGKNGIFLELLLEKIFNDQTPLVAKGEFGELERLQLLSEEVTELIPDPDRRNLCQALCLLGRGRNAQAQEQFDEAAASYKKLLAQVRKHKQLQAFEPSLLTNLGAVQQVQGDFVGALKNLQDARKLLDGLDADHRAVIEPLLTGNLGSLQMEMGDYPEAEKALKESLRLALRRGDAGTAFNARVNLATIELHRCHYRSAIDSFEELLADCKKKGQKFSEGKVLNNLGLALEEAGRRGDALLRLEEARKLGAAIKQPRSEALALGNMAMVHVRLGENEEAAVQNEKAMKLFDAVGDKAGIARCLKLRGILHLDAKRNDEAEKAFGRCLEMAKVQGNKAALAEMNLFIGVQYYDARDWSKAKPALEAALKGYVELGDSRRILIARHLLLMVMAVTDDERYLQELLAFKLDANLFKDPYAELRADKVQAFGHFTQKQWALAESAASKIIRTLESRVALTVDPQLRAALSSGAHANDFRDAYMILAASRAEQGNVASAFQAIEQGKARVLIDLLESAGDGIQRGMSAEEKKEEERLRAAVVAASRKESSIRQFAAEDPNQAEKIKKELVEAETSFEAFRRKLFTDHPHLMVQQGRLPEVDLVELQRDVFVRQPDLAIVSYLAQYNRLLMVVITAGDDRNGPAKIAVHSLKLREKELAEAAKEFSRSCQNPNAGRPNSDDLWKWLIVPIEKELAGKKHLVVIPCTPLLTLPFQALAADLDAKTPFLIEQYAISYAPSVSALLKMRNRGDVVRAKGVADRPIVAVGGVKFSADLAELKHSGPEALAVGKEFGEQSRVLLGEKATRAAITESAQKARFLHLATHGLPNGLRPLFSAVAVAPDRDDGRLYGHDVINMELSTELVVLSACQTARGREFQGEGTIGLAWAFFVAGSPALVTTQWSVDDEATSELMKAFYSRLRAGSDSSRAESLRQAQIDLLKNKTTRHPFYWAPFIFTGDWRK